MKRSIESFGDGEVRLRLVEASDLPTLLAWRNRDDSRVWFKTSAKLSAETHRAWYDRYHTLDHDYFFVVEASGVPVGQCAIYDINRDDGSAQIGRFLAAPDHRGKGYITRSCAQLVQFATSTLGMRYLFLEVMEGNAPAIDIYSRCGFTEESRSDGLLRMGMGLSRA